MDYKLIKVEKKGHLTIVIINRPEVRNAVNPPTSIEMQDAFEEFNNDPNAWVAILTGTGDKAFSAGNDLKYDALTPPNTMNLHADALTPRIYYCLVPPVKYRPTHTKRLIILSSHYASRNTCERKTNGAEPPDENPRLLSSFLLSCITSY